MGIVWNGSASDFQRSIAGACVGVSPPRALRRRAADWEAGDLCVVVARRRGGGGRLRYSSGSDEDGPGSRHRPRPAPVPFHGTPPCWRSPFQLQGGHARGCELELHACVRPAGAPRPVGGTREDAHRRSRRS
eukprot:gene14287-biopygen5760